MKGVLFRDFFKLNKDFYFLHYSIFSLYYNVKVVVQLKESHEKQIWSEKEKSEKEKKLELLKNKVFIFNII